MRKFNFLTFLIDGNIGSYKHEQDSEFVFIFYDCVLRRNILPFQSGEFVNIIVNIEEWYLVIETEEKSITLDIGVEVDEI